MERESLSKQRAACPRVYSDTLFGPSSNRLICSPLLTVDSDGVVSPPEPFSLSMGANTVDADSAVSKEEVFVITNNSDREPNFISVRVDPAPL
ncbi:unnamed protein product [Arctogadus glacialis]